MYDYKARHYDPLLGRFTSPDTLIPEPGSPLAWDRYAYVKNNPVRFNDPTGHVNEPGTGGGGIPDDILKKAQAKAAIEVGNTYYGKRVEGNYVGWVGLPWRDRAILEQGGYNEALYNEYVLPALTKADPLHDPAVWIALSPFILRSGVLRQAALSSCISNPSCSSFFLNIQPYGEMPSLPDYHRHHIIEKRFAAILGIDPNTIPSVYITPDEHRLVTAAWKALIGYDGHNTAITTANATIDDIWKAAQVVYGGNRILLEAARIFLGK